MREILFRGKRADNGEWIFGGYAKCNNRHYILPDIDLIGKEWVFKNVEVIPETVGQYIGLTDKNGKKIFEGDILSERPDGNKIAYIGTVEWDDERALFRFIIKDNPKYFACLGTYSTSYKVIGTIYDNPELLEVMG